MSAVVHLGTVLSRKYPPPTYSNLKLDLTFFRRFSSSFWEAIITSQNHTLMQLSDCDDDQLSSDRTQHVGRVTRAAKAEVRRPTCVGCSDLVRRQRLHRLGDAKYAESKHTTVMLAATANSTMPKPAPSKAAMNTGTARTASKRNTTGTALGRAALTVQPIHLMCLGTMTRGSALQ